MHDRHGLGRRELVDERKRIDQDSHEADEDETVDGPTRDGEIHVALAANYFAINHIFRRRASYRRLIIPRL